MSDDRIINYTKYFTKKELEQLRKQSGKYSFCYEKNDQDVKQISICFKQEVAKELLRKFQKIAEAHYQNSLQDIMSNPHSQADSLNFVMNPINNLRELCEKLGMTDEQIDESTPKTYKWINQDGDIVFFKNEDNAISAQIESDQDKQLSIECCNIPEEKEDTVVDQDNAIQSDILTESKTIDKANAIVVYDENTALSIITENTYHSQIQSLGDPGQLQYEFKSDGSTEIVPVEDSQMKKALMEKRKMKGFNVALLTTIGTGIEKAYLEGADGTISIPREGLAKHLGVDIRKPSKEVLDYILSNKTPITDQEKKYHDNLMKYYSFWFDLVHLQRAGTYTTKDGSFIIFVFEGYNESNDSIECSSPYLRHAFEDLYKNQLVLDKRNNEEIKKPLIAHRVMKGNIYNIRNDVTKEIILEIVYRIEKRGIQPDSQKNSHYTYSDNKSVRMLISYQQLIDSCPTLQRRLKESIKKDGSVGEPSSEQKKEILNRAIFGNTRRKQDKSKKTTTSIERDKSDSLIEALLKECSVYFDMYANFKIEADKISLKALTRTGIHISHRGINGDYQKEPMLHAPDIIKND